MAKVVALDGPALAWARGRFAGYYRATPVPAPVRLPRREFAAFPFATETLMRRHAAFASADELRGYLAREAPRHVYYSTAYYRKPAEPTMGQKEWLGADLIFDLDADHLRGAERLDYAQQLDLVKVRLRALVEDFLLGDFGVDPQALAVVFSGGRGYHVHVREERFLPMSSPERRELVEYLSGTGFDPAAALRRVRERGFRAEEGESSPRVGRGTRFLPSPDAPGWTGRTARSVLALLARWESVGLEGTQAEIERLGFPKARAREWAGFLVTDRGARRILDDPARALPPAVMPEKLFEAVLREAEIVVQGETDAPVTTDIHRLIRLPGSLHGGTGFRVTPIPFDRLDEFDPFRDAAVVDGRDEQVRVTLRATASYPFPGGSVRIEEGGSDELPTPVALFLVLRGEAELRPSPG